MENPKYKVGDVVVMAIAGRGFWEEGDIAKILCINDDNYTATFAGYNDTCSVDGVWFVMEDWIDHAIDSEVIDLSKQSDNKKIDSHYNFTYYLSEDEIETGELRLDPYFVAKQWKLGSRDDSGALWHCFKTIARYGDKNPVEREIKALHLQVKRLAELNNVDLD